MKKFFTLIAAALMAVGASAETITKFDYTVASGGGTASVGTVEIGSTSKVESSTIASGGYAYKLDGDSGSKYLKATLTSSVQAGDVISIQCYAASNPEGYGVSFGSENFTALGNVVTTAKNTLETLTYTVKAEDSGLIGKTDIYFFRNPSKSTFLVGVKIVGEPAPAVSPKFTLTRATINQYQNSQIQVSDNGSLDGLTLSDLSYDDAIISIDAAGKVTPIAAGTSIITFNTAATDKYSASTGNSLSIQVVNVTLDERVNVTASAAWDWSKFGTSEIKLEDETNPAKTTEFVLSNAIKYGLCDAIGSEFGNAQQLAVVTEYVVRDGKYFQGPSIKFNTTVAGKLSITYCNTGNRSDEAQRRYVNVNGTNYGDGSIFYGGRGYTTDNLSELFNQLATDLNIPEREIEKRYSIINQLYEGNPQLIAQKFSEDILLILNQEVTALANAEANP